MTHEVCVCGCVGGCVDGCVDGCVNDNTKHSPPPSPYLNGGALVFALAGVAELNMCVRVCGCAIMCLRVTV